jgi:hypothetical protein
MLYGIVASEGSENLSAPIAPFTGLGQFNFVTGVYEWGATTLAASAVVDQTGWIGAHGLQVPASQAAGANLLYAPLKTFLAGCQFTLAFEIETHITGGKQQIFFIASVGGDDVGVDYFESFEMSDDVDTFGSRYVGEFDNAQTNGTFRVAITRVDADLSISVEGHTVHNAGVGPYVAPQPGNAIVYFSLGGTYFDTSAAVNIHWMKVYNAVADIDLPALS